MAPIDPGADIVDPVRDIIDESLFDQGPSSSKNVGRTKPTRYLRKVAKGIKSQLHEALEPAQLVTTAKDRTKKAKREKAAEKTSGKAATKKRDRSEDVATVLHPASNKPNASNRPSRSRIRASIPIHSAKQSSTQSPTQSPTQSLIQSPTQSLIQ